MRRTHTERVRIQRSMVKWNRTLVLVPLGESRRPIRYFLSAFNTIQTLLLRQKLGAIRPDNTKVSWIIDYRTVCSLLEHRVGFVAAERQWAIHDLRLGCGSRRPHIPSDDSSVVDCRFNGYFVRLGNELCGPRRK